MSIAKPYKNFSSSDIVSAIVPEKPANNGKRTRATENRIPRNKLIPKVLESANRIRKAAEE